MKDAVCSLAITFFILGALFDFSKIVLKLFQIDVQSVFSARFCFRPGIFKIS